MRGSAPEDAPAAEKPVAPDGETGHARPNESNAASHQPGDENPSPARRALAQGAERAAREKLRGVAGAGEPGRTRLPARYAGEKAALNSIVAAHPEWVLEPEPGREIPGGAEHHVETSADGRRMVKHTKDGFGYAVDAEVATFGGVLSLRQALPSEYLTRLDLTNEALGDDLRFEGFTRMGDQAGFVISQRAIAGVLPTPQQIRGWFEANGFQQVPAERIDNDYIKTTTWWHPDAKLFVTDAKPKNFVREAGGEIVPIDLITQRVAPGSPIDRVLRWDF